MGFLDNMKDRLGGFGKNSKNDYDNGYDNYDEYDGDYDEGDAYDESYDATGESRIGTSGGYRGGYFDEESYEDGYQDGYDNNLEDGRASLAGRVSLAGARQSYQMDNHPPLITMGDVRAQDVAELQDAGKNLHRSVARNVTNGAGDIGTSVGIRDIVDASAGIAVRDIDDGSSGVGARSAVDAGIGVSARSAVDAGIGVSARGIGDGNTDVAMRSFGNGNSSVAARSLSDTGSMRTVREPYAINATQLRGDTPEYYASRSGQVKARSTTGNLSAHPFRQLIVVRPSAYGEAEKISLALKENHAVAVDLRNTRPELGKRILDFSFGAASALGGQVDMPANRVYTITIGYGITDEEHELLVARGIV